MANFTDNRGYTWPLEIKVRDIERVRTHVTGVNGKPVDLLDIAEKGDFSAVEGSVQTILNVIFWLCFDEIMANFDREQWDKDHADLYEMVPDEKRKTPLQKAADWFGERIGGEQMVPMAKAWEEAILNFIPNPRVREALQRVIQREEVYQTKLIEASEQDAMTGIAQNEARLGKSSSNSRGRSGSTRRTSRSASS